MSILNYNLKKREENFSKHTKFLRKYEKYFILPKQLPQSKSGWLAYPITIKEKIQVFGGILLGKSYGGESITKLTLTEYNNSRSIRIFTLR